METNLMIYPVLKPITFLDLNTVADGRPGRIEKFDLVIADYTDGTRQPIWFPRIMSTVDFSITAVWIKRRSGSQARLNGLEFDR